jgi:protein disulfide-isomerase
MPQASKAFLPLVVLAVVVPAVPAQTVKWLSDLNVALGEAKRKRQPIVVDFSTENCCWCKKLELTTFRDPAVLKMLADQFVVVRIDAALEPTLAQSFGVSSYPTLVFVGPDGKTLGKQEGYVDASQFIQQLQWAVEKCGVSREGVRTPPTAVVRTTICPVLQAASPEETFAEKTLEAAESALRAGKTEAAIELLDCVQRTCAGSRYAVIAGNRLAALRPAEPAPPIIGTQAP